MRYRSFVTPLYADSCSLLLSFPLCKDETGHLSPRSTATRVLSSSRSPYVRARHVIRHPALRLLCSLFPSFPVFGLFPPLFFSFCLPWVSLQAIFPPSPRLYTVVYGCIRLYTQSSNLRRGLTRFLQYPYFFVSYRFGNLFSFILTMCQANLANYASVGPTSSLKSFILLLLARLLTPDSMFIQLFCSLHCC